jgi:hypothetical protein
MPQPIMGIYKKQNHCSSFAKLPDNSCAKRDFLNHLRSLARLDDEATDYPEVSKVVFPGNISIAYAVCHPECGAAEFIVDGSTQERQYCGSLMFRAAVAEYKLVGD